ncbi:MAG: peptidylprolyl isomerase [Flavobacteriales bacterium]|nr:peptidylprolyl isomerase [Flavobacteriales bacterium]
MKKIYFLIMLLCFQSALSAQSIDKVEAIIGSEILLTSDIENQYNQFLSQGIIDAENLRCDILDELLFQNLLVHHAKIDSTINVSSEEIDQEVNKRITYFESQLGSLDKVEAYFKRSVESINEELSFVVKDQFFSQKKQSSIIDGVKVTPKEVKTFYQALGQIDIPVVPTQVELSQIVVLPNISQEEKKSIKDKLNSFRKRIYDGEDFKVLAALYSDDIVSANNGGELGFVNRGDLVPEFERAAFKLANEEVSEVIESKFGFHIIQMLERRGEQINVRHILIKPKFSSMSLKNANDDISKIKSKIDSSYISFDDAVKKYSDDDSKNNGGLIINSSTGSSDFSLDELDPTIRYMIEKMGIGDISDPSLTKSNDATQAAYRIIRLNSRIVEHKANIVDDFDVLKEYALSDKRQKIIDKWIKDNIPSTYIKVSEGLSDCTCYNKWMN